MNTQIEFDEDNQTFGFDEWEYLNFRSSTQLGEDVYNILEKLKILKNELHREIKQTKEETQFLKSKIASLNGKLGASINQYKKLNDKYSEYIDVKEYILSDCPDFLPWNSTAMRIKARHQELKNEIESLKRQIKEIDML
jgi:chromosome segregation ATPase